MDRKKIGIIGCGATGTSLFTHLVDDCVKKKIGHLITIYIFEKSADIARGIPYSFDYDCNLLNRTIHKMSVRHDKPNDFFLWIKKNNERIVNLYPAINLADENTYLPRSVFGLYLHDVFLQTMSYAKQNNIRVNIVRDEVINIQNRNDEYDITTNNNNFIGFNFAVLTIGHVPCGKFKQLAHYKNFYNSPYPTTQLVSTIDKNSSVGIVGSRLSAIDAAISLTEHGHCGKIYFFSRSEFLPSIKSSSTDQYIKLMEETEFRNIDKYQSITLKKVMKLITDLASHYNGEKSYFYKWLNRPIDPIAFLRFELNEYEQKIRRIWDALFLDGNNIIELIWNKLSKKEKHWFLYNYRSKWLSYRVGIPKTNAEKILTLLEKKQLSIVRTKYMPVYENDVNQFFVKSFDENATIKVDYLINATGSPLTTDDMESVLIKNLLDSGVIQTHEFGGIDVDFLTSKIINNQGNMLNNLYAIGSVTAGVYFFTSVLALNIKHAFNISTQIIKDVLDVQSIVVNI